MVMPYRDTIYTCYQLQKLLDSLQALLLCLELWINRQLMICTKQKSFKSQSSVYTSALLRLHVGSSCGLRSLVVQRNIPYTLNPLTNIFHELACNTHHNPFVDEE